MATGKVRVDFESLKSQQISQATHFPHCWCPVHAIKDSIIPVCLKKSLGVRVQCCFTSTETLRTIVDGEPRTATSTFSQLLRSETQQFCLGSLYSSLLPARIRGGGWGGVDGGRDGREGDGNRPHVRHSLNSACIDPSFFCLSAFSTKNVAFASIP